jgi:LysW-gamma-L-lysine carboxypeptidase
MDEVGALVELLKAYSPSGSEERAAQAFATIAKSLGYTTELDGAGNPIARRGRGNPQVLFLGHIDTVDGEIPVSVEGGRIQGRGACDAKGPLVAALLAGARHEGPGEIVVIGAVGEEKDSRGARYLIPRMKPNYLIVGEPSKWDGVTIGYKGNLDLLFTFEGERTHLSSPSPTTLELALVSLYRLQAWGADYQDETAFKSLTHKVHTINTGRVGGREIVKVGVNVRLPPSVKVADAIAFLDSTDLKGRYRVGDSSDAVEVDRTNEVVRSLMAGIRELGGQPTLFKKSGSADLNLAVPVWGCPAAAYGPGDAHLDHTEHESLDVGEFHNAIRVLERAFASLTQRRFE